MTQVELDQYGAPVTLRHQIDCVGRLASSSVLVNHGIAAALCEITEIAAEALDVDRISIWRRGEKETDAVCVEAFDSRLQKHEQGEIRDRTQRKSLLEILGHKHVLAINDTATDMRIAAIRESEVQPGKIGAVLIVSLRQEGDYVGAMAFCVMGRPHHWTAEEQAFAGVFAEFVSRSLETDKRRKIEVAFRAYAESASDWFWESDATHHFTYLSEKFYEITGDDPADIIGKGWSETGRTIEDPEAAEEFDRALERHEPFRNVLASRILPDNKKQWIEFSGKPFFDEQGAFKGYHGVSTDVTERIEMERALSHRDEQLRQVQKLETVGQLTGGVAHDFNNILAIIQGNLDLLSRRIPSNSALSRYLDPAIAATSRGANLTHRLLEFARRQPLHATAVNISELIAGMDGILQSSIGSGISSKFICETGLWHCQVDRAQLEQAILNLAINARDAMAGNGELVIEAGNVHIDEAAASEALELVAGDYVQLVVTDTGVGMHSDVADRVFEPFFTTKDVGQGTGLGLSMVYGMVKQSEGHVTVESELGTGTTFRLYLSRAEADKPLERPKAAETLPTANTGETVLLIEDDNDLRQMVEELIRSLGYQVFGAGDYRTAKQYWSGDQRIDLLLTDITLPGDISGTEIAARARQDRPSLKVIYMSGHAGTAPIIKQDPDGILLQKPFLLVDLAKAIRSTLHG